MYLRTLPVRGVPPRGSVQDRIAGQMLIREQRRQVHGQVYLGRLLSLVTNISPKLFDIWTSLYAQEVTHETYTPEAILDKQQTLDSLAKTAQNEQQYRVDMFAKLEKLTANDQDLRPITEAEREEIKRKLRRRHLKQAQREPASLQISKPQKSDKIKPTQR